MTTTPTTPPTVKFPNKWQPAPEQREILEALLAEAKQEKSIVEFARKFLPFDRSKFDQIMDVLNPDRSESYFDKIKQPSREELMEKLKGILESVPMTRQRMSQIDELAIIETSRLKAVSQAVDEASNKTGPERLIIHLAPTGGGKTIICNYLGKSKNARFVEVRDVWRQSATGYVPLKDICAGVGHHVKKNDNFIAGIQDSLIKYCEGRKIVICFDEGEHFGTAALNLLKLLLNKTRIVPVVSLNPVMYEKWFAYYANEAEQIARRTHAIIDSSIISEDDASLFFPPDQFAQPTEAIRRITLEANTFGHYSLIARVAKILNGTDGSHIGFVNQSIAKAQRQMRRVK